MAQTQFGPVNISQGNSAKFIIEFLSSGVLTVPSSGNLVVSYTNLSNTSVNDTVDLTVSNSFFTGIWSSASAALGTATWVLTAAGSTSTQQTGQLRIIEP